MRILLLHNRYRWPGGEDAVVADEAALLRSRGHEVKEHFADNKEAVAAGRLAVALALSRGAWSRRSFAQVRGNVEAFKPDIVHAHNLWFMLSPSILAAAHGAGCAVVETLHNFRLVCPGASLLDRCGRRCQDCVGRAPWRGMVRRCYHDSFLASAAVARMIAFNRRRGTWADDVDLFTTPSEFCRQVFVRGGLAADRVVMKPNFVTDPLAGSGTIPEMAGGKPRVIYVGRLSREKGLGTLLSAWPEVERSTGGELRIVGQGPLETELRKAGSGLSVSFVGQRPAAEIPDELRMASLLVLPSEWYEPFGRVVTEAYAMGRPAVVSNLGGLAGLMRHGETGSLFEAGNAADLAEKLTRLLTDRDTCRRMGQVARAEYLAKYTPERNYEQLMDCYQRAMEIHAGHAKR